MSSEQLKHLEFIQNVITRMNSNSFQIKGWAVTIISALLAVYSTNNNNSLILICILPTTVFWFLDSYYLCQERKFRGLYNDIAEVSKVENRKELKIFEMRPDLYVDGKYSYCSSLLSGTMLIFYLPLILILFGLYLIFNCII